jgi:hypothetical protein
MAEVVGRIVTLAGNLGPLPDLVGGPPFEH